MDKKVLVNLIPFLFVGAIVGLLVESSLQGNFSSLKKVLEEEALARSIMPLILTQSSSSKAVLLDLDQLEVFSEKKIEAYDKHSELLDLLAQKTTDETIKQQIIQLRELDKNQMQPIDEKILETAFEDIDQAKGIYFSQFVPLETKYKEGVQSIIDRTLERKKIETNDMQENNKNSLQVILTALAIGFCVVCLSLYFTANLIMSEVSQELSTLSNNVSAISTSATTLESYSNAANCASDNQAERVKVAIEAVESNKKIIDESTDFVKQNGNSVNEAMKAANSGNQRVQEALTQAKKLEESREEFNSITTVMEEISESVKILSKIVFSTEILSTNATIEAVKAKEYGKSFIIVADEVKNLAQSSRKEAEKINKIVETSKVKVTEIINSIDKKINAINASFDHVDASFTQIFQNVKGIHKNSQTLEELATTQSKNASTVRETMSEIMELNGKTTDMASNTLTKANGLRILSEDLTQAHIKLNDIIKGRQTTAEASGEGSEQAHHPKSA